MSLDVFMIAAITVDGFIARESAQISTAWTSKEDAAWFNRRTKEAGVVVMGSTTFETIGRALPGRLTIVLTSQPEVYRQRYPQLSEESVVFMTATPDETLNWLKDKNYSEVAICGGSSIYTAFMKAGLITRIYLTVEPVVFGKGVGLFSEDVDVHLTLVGEQKLSEQTVVREFTCASRQS